jgi:hypothetical protein
LGSQSVQRVTWCCAGMMSVAWGRSFDSLRHSGKELSNKRLARPDSTQRSPGKQCKHTL